jgi:predicted membrane-bound mannosyltransferase
VLVFASIGAVSAFRTRRPDAWDVRLARFLVFYTVILFAAYSAVAYKTPWCALGFYHGCILLAGLGTAAVLKWAGTAAGKTAAFLILVISLMLVLRQSILLNGRYDSDPGNPWVYAQTLPDVYQIVRSVEKAADSRQDGQGTRIDVIVKDHEYWPLPWYFRKWTSIGWHSEIPENGAAAQIVIVSAGQEPDLARALEENPEPGSRPFYIPLWQKELFLRPGLEIRGYRKIKD